ncbi:MAG: hypothetical protein KKE39_03425 [Bacteroidetes bacterium]|nr:hypothetical protein [Bacteroidota bacterium]MBU1373212.1 hypothetical protein [Bacteroidota bacterium]MBU1760569.1 hypothetical protein [Bacteroidota bacterium]MBU2045135.1 hypothetical protein [Bacteroidota bacterium]
MNQMMSRGWIDSLLSPHRFNDVTRIADSTEANEFFRESKLKLIQPKTWVQPVNFDSCNKITCFDRYGFEIDRPIIVGDKLKLNFNYEINGRNILWLRIIELTVIKELDGYEEEIFLLLQETKNDSLIPLNNTSISSGECAITLKRLINTISLDMKIKPALNNSLFEPSEHSLMLQFNWKRLMKNILSQL